MTQTAITQVEDKGTVRPSADIVANSAADLRATFRRMVSDGVREITVDFSDVVMLDSAGIGLLVAVHNSLRKVSGHLRIIHASTEIIDLLRMMRIHQHIEVSGE